jgi:hypothetical protein
MEAGTALQSSRIPHNYISNEQPCSQKTKKGLDESAQPLDKTQVTSSKPS